MNQPNIKLTDEELATVAPFFEACDARKEGFAQGMETAKTILIQQILARRKPNDPDRPVANAQSSGNDAKAPDAPTGLANGHA